MDPVALGQGSSHPATHIRGGQSHRGRRTDFACARRDAFPLPASHPGGDAAVSAGAGHRAAGARRDGTLRRADRGRRACSHSGVRSASQRAALGQFQCFRPGTLHCRPGEGALALRFLPFGGGPRICIRAGFATIEAAVILATVVRSFRFAPLAGHKPKPIARVTLRPEGGMPLLISAR
jgi:hypothetical protein